MNVVLLFVLTAVLTALVAPVYKLAVKKSDVFCLAFLTTALLTLAFFLCVVFRSKLSAFQYIQNTVLLDVLLDGMFLSLTVLFLFLSLKYGLMRILIPVYSIGFYYVLTFNRILEDKGVNLLFFGSSILYVTGIVLMLMKEKKDRRNIKKQGILYAVISVVCFCFMYTYRKLYHVKQLQDYDIRNLLAFAVAMCAMMLFCVLFQKIRLMKKCFQKENLPLLSASAATAVLVFLLFNFTREYEAYNAIFSICFPVAVLFSCIMQKEKFSNRSVIGAFLVTAGLFIILFFK